MKSKLQVLEAVRTLEQGVDNGALTNVYEIDLFRGALLWVLGAKNENVEWFKYRLRIAAESKKEKEKQ